MNKSYLKIDDLVLELITFGEEIYAINFVAESESKNETKVEAETDFSKKIKKELLEYFDGTKKEFDLKLVLKGTEFQKKVWKELQKIPYGQTASYGEIAKNIGNPKGARAIGMACNRNPIPIIVPCHRVIGKSGKLTGYAGGLDIKVKLLKIENMRRE